MELLTTFITFNPKADLAKVELLLFLVVVIAPLLGVIDASDVRPFTIAESTQSLSMLDSRMLPLSRS
jgi:hypothetical protein